MKVVTCLLLFFCICDCDYIDRDYELTEAIETHSKYVQLLEPDNKVEATLKKDCDVPSLQFWSHLPGRQPNTTHNLQLTHS